MLFRWQRILLTWTMEMNFCSGALGSYGNEKAKKREPPCRAAVPRILTRHPSGVRREEAINEPDLIREKQAENEAHHPGSQTKVPANVAQPRLSK